jgi:anaerobic selenocysteine-containing dehydrogenase
MLDEIESGNLRALVVFGGNPVSAFPNTERTCRALASLDVLVVLDVVDTDTTALASHVLPCKGQLERADIPFFTDQFNLDFSTQYTDAVVAPIGDVRSMWWITARIAAVLGTSVMPESLSVDSDDADVLAYIARRSARLAGYASGSCPRAAGVSHPENCSSSTPGGETSCPPMGFSPPRNASFATSTRSIHR